MRSADSSPTGARGGRRLPQKGPGSTEEKLRVGVGRSLGAQQVPVGAGAQHDDPALGVTAVMHKGGDPARQPSQEGRKGAIYLIHNVPLIALAALLRRLWTSGMADRLARPGVTSIQPAAATTVPCPGADTPNPGLGNDTVARSPRQPALRRPEGGCTSDTAALLLAHGAASRRASEGHLACDTVPVAAGQPGRGRRCRRRPKMK